MSGNNTKVTGSFILAKRRQENTSIATELELHWGGTEKILAWDIELWRRRGLWGRRRGIRRGGRGVRKELVDDAL